MLVLTRKLDEAIRIGEDIKITVIRVKGNTVRLGIEAPRNVRVVRDELDKHAEPSDQVSSGSRRAAVGTASAIAAPHLASQIDAVPGQTAVDPAPPATTPAFAAEITNLYRGLAARGEMRSVDDAVVITTVVDSPQPSGTRLFMGKAKLGRPAARLVEHEGGDQAAPLRAFLRSGRKLQAAS